MPSIRWLHLSDFHVGQDDYAQRRLFTYILDHIRARIAAGAGPDIVFISGDLAYGGKASEYEEFVNSFLLPLMELLGDRWPGKIFTIPGNHDVDRTRAKAVQRYNILQHIPEFLDPSERGLSERQALFPRFQAYVASDLSETGGNWLFAKEGFYTTTIARGDHTIGILGINTAWLCGSDHDRHELTPGKGIVETGLEAIKECDLRIVLGHHPIDWFIDEDIPSIRALFGKNNVIYLHGHLHKTVSSHEEGAGYPFLSMQSGASFQAREDEQWVNRFLWCELDLDRREIWAEPLRWSRDNQEWSLDGAALPERYRKPGTDRWVLALPQAQARDATPANKPQAPQLARRFSLPYGWALIDAAFLAARRADLTSEQVLRYFDGRVPSWEEAIFPKIPRRTIVRELCSELEAARGTDELQVILLLGAGGEGKSTAIRQVVCELVDREADWNIVWQNEPETHISVEDVLKLPKTSGRWLFVSDDADTIARDVFRAIRALHEAGRRDFRFLLGCRDTDWIGAEADKLPWKQYTSFVEQRIRGVSAEDAAMVVRAWGDYGSRGMGKLYGLDVQEAAARLVKEARSEGSKDEGAFLGAMLRVRMGEDLKAHVTSLLMHLKDRKAPSGTLMDGLAYIAALHAENILILSKEVLAKAIGCSYSDVKRQIIGPLGEETVVTTAGNYVLIRHRAIAQAAVEILEHSFFVDFDEIYVRLVQAARKLFLSGAFVPNIREWNYLSSYFFERGRHSLGIRLARALVQVEPTNPYFMVNLARLLREVGQPEQAVRVFREAPDNVQKDRAYYYEWGTSEGNMGNHGLSVWLAGVSLADGTETRPIDNDRAKISLTGLAIACAELFDRYNRPVFIEACGAAAQLGLGLRLDPKTEADLLRSQAKSREAGVDDVDPLTALDRMRLSASAAWEQREIELPEWVKEGRQLSFRSLARLLRIA